MEKNKELRQAKEKLEGISADERMQRIAELRQKAIMDEKATYAKGLDDGKAIGEEIGREIGKKDGIIIGEEKGKMKIAKNMIRKNIELDTIIELTGLTKEQIESIK